MAVVQRYKLDSGPEVILCKCETKLARALICFRVGSFLEKENESGISHLIEHLSFESNPNKSGEQFNKEMRYYGASTNADTSYELVRFHFQSIPSVFFDALKNFMTQISSFTAEENIVEKEKGVVLQELDMLRDQNGWVNMYNLLQAAYPKHAISRPVIGYSEIIKDFTTEQIQEYFDNYFTTENMFIIIVGDEQLTFDAENKMNPSLETLLEEETAKFKKGFEYPRRSFLPSEYELYDRSIKYFKPGLIQTNLFATTLFDHADEIKVCVTATILGRGLGSYFYNEFREKRNITYSVHAHSMHMDTDHLLLTFSTILTEEKDVEEALSIFRSSFDYLTEVSEDTFVAAKRQFLTEDLIYGQAIDYLADDFVEQYLDGETVLTTTRIEDLINNLEYKDFMDWVKSSFQEKKSDMVYAILAPQN